MIALILCQLIALEGATVHTMEPGQAAQVATVLVRDGVIEAVGTDLAIPEDAERIDLSGKHLVPGLIDGMANHDPEHDPLHTASGVLLLRDVGNDLERIAGARIARENPLAVGPDLFICGLVFDGQPPATTNAVVVRSAEEVTGKLESLRAWEIDFVATHTGIPVDAWRQLLIDAHEAGLDVWGPQPVRANLDEVLASGQDGLLFLDSFAPKSIDGVLSAEEIESYARKLAASGMALTPGLRAYARYLDDGGDAPLPFLSPAYEMQWKSERAARMKYAGEAGWNERMQASIASQRKLLAAMHAAGVPLVPGSGTPHPWLAPGSGLHDELAEWKLAGIGDAELLRLTTIGAARALGVEDRFGAIKAGLVANLVVANADPREDIGHLREPAGVVLRGTWYEGAELQRWRAGVREYQTGVRDALEAEFIVEPPELPEGAAKLLSGTVETRVFGLRTAVEEYVVARQLDGKLAYAMRRKSPPGLGMPDTETELLQVMDGKALSSFRLSVRSGGSEYLVTGVRIGGQFRVQRRVDGQQLDTNSTQSRPVFVDVGSALPAIILAKHRGTGTSRVLYFEGMDPAVSQWSTELRDNGLFVIATPSGAMVAALNKDGSLRKVQRQKGNDLERYVSTRSTSYGGPGLALPEERVFQAPEPVEAGAPADGASEPKGPKVR